VSDLLCRDEQRRGRVRAADLNGIDYLEVSDDQRTLTVRFLGRAPELATANVRIDGGRRVKGIKVESIDVCRQEDAQLDDCLTIRVDRPGDFSTYTLRLVEPDERGRPGERPLAGFDRRYASLPFSFKAACPTDLDCQPADDCRPPARSEPEISYLAKDYASFRQLILDRLGLIMPAWQERHVPDLGIALVELLAYVGDYLSYHQDAVATEAYLETARRRVSVRRHARLVDYPMHDGCNARGWVVLEVEADLELRDGDFYFVTGLDAPSDRGPSWHVDDLRGWPSGSYEVFEPLLPGAVQLRAAHNRIDIWTWGDQECCLPRGATRATLVDGWREVPAEEPPDPKAGPKRPAVGYAASAVPPTAGYAASAIPPASGYAASEPGSAERPRWLDLRPGDVLIFEEVIGPTTGATADADPSHRQAVRLTRVEPGVDDLYDQPIVEVEWAPADALRFPLCISTVGGPTCRRIDAVSVARGNAILVDHGRSLSRRGGRGEELTVPTATAEPTGCAGVGRPCAPLVRRPRFEPLLKEGPITHRAAFPAPSRVAEGQAGRIDRVLGQVRERVAALLARARGGQVLTPEELVELRRIFESRALREVGLLAPEGVSRAAPSAAQQAVAIARLLAHEDRLLARKRRRLEILAGRGRAGYLLGPAVAAEVGALFGERYAAGLGLAEPAHFGPADGALRQDPRAALPQLRLEEATPSGPAWWEPRRDLLGAGGRERALVAEIEDDGRARLRFGDGDLGRAVEPGATLWAHYRIGNGPAGNLGIGVVDRLVSDTTRYAGVSRVRNPLPTEGGVEPEPLAEVKLFAPATFRDQLARAITAEDYAALARGLGGLQRAVGELRWNGSWYEARVGVDPFGSVEPEPERLSWLREALEPYRRIGHDLVVQPAAYVPLDVKLVVCVEPHHRRAEVERALRDAFGSREVAGGRGYFHPDRLTFGDDVRLSRLVALARSIPGVENVLVERLQVQLELPRGEVERGVLPIGPLEIARLDNDPSEPEHGRIDFELRGGR
jgi:predicted phage baseplate assembly protein